MIYASRFLEVKASSEKKIVFSSHGGDFGDCDGTKPRFRRVTLQRPPRDTPPTNLVVFSRHSAPLIFKQYLRVLPCDSAVSGAAPPSILEFSTFPSSMSPASFQRFLRLRIFGATRNPSLIYRRKNNLRNFRTTNLSNETYLLVFIYELIKRSID